jgi:protein involved in polysaccharide export with SLBB domain
MAGRAMAQSTGATPGVGATDGAPTSAGASMDAVNTGAFRGVGALAGPIDPATYRIGPGDVLQLVLSGEVSRSIPLEVDPEGMVLVPGTGNLRVEGRTLADVRADLLRRMRDQFHHVSIDVRLSTLRAFRVQLTGEVREPGMQVVTGGMRVGDLVRPAALLESASQRRIEVRRRDGRVETADLALLLRAGDGSHDPLLQDGDVVHVPVASAFIHAEGAVARPGHFELAAGDSLTTLLRLAGGVLPSAVLDRALLITFVGPSAAESTWVDLREVLAGRSTPTLRDGTRLYVYAHPRYTQQQQVAVYGEVARPGTYPILEGVTRLSDLLRGCGGFLDGSEQSSIRVHRRAAAAADRDPELDRLLRLSQDQLTVTEYAVLRTKLAGLREDYRVDWSQVKEDGGLDLLLRDGDLVRVERKVLSIRVDGEVRRPGIVNYVPGQSAEDYVRAAGGFTSRAWRGKVRVTRAVTGQTLLAHNVHRLDPGDFVWVPERSDVTAWDQFSRLLTTLAQIATVVIAVRSIR